MNKINKIKKSTYNDLDVDIDISTQKPSEKMANIPTQSREYTFEDYSNINSAPRNGSLIVVSKNGDDKGEIVFWKRTRAMSNATHRWEETGFFVNNLTGMGLSFVPKYWRPKSIYEI